MTGKKPRQEPAQRLDDGSHTKRWRERAGCEPRCLAWETGVESFHESESVLTGLMGQMKVDHGGVDLLVAQKGLDGVETGATFEHVRGKAVPKGVCAAEREAEFFASENQEALDRSDGHGIEGGVHALAERLTVGLAAACVGKKQERVAMESPVASQLFHHGGWNGNHAVFESLAGANEELVFVAEDVVDGEAEAL